MSESKSTNKLVIEEDDRDLVVSKTPYRRKKRVLKPFPTGYESLTLDNAETFELADEVIGEGEGAKTLKVARSATVPDTKVAGRKIRLDFEELTLDQLRELCSRRLGITSCNNSTKLQCRCALAASVQHALAHKDDEEQPSKKQRQEVVKKAIQLSDIRERHPIATKVRHSKAPAPVQQRKKPPSPVVLDDQEGPVIVKRSDEWSESKTVTIKFEDFSMLVDEIRSQPFHCHGKTWLVILKPGKHSSEEASSRTTVCLKCTSPPVKANVKVSFAGATDLQRVILAKRTEVQYFACSASRDTVECSHLGGSDTLTVKFKIQVVAALKQK